MIRRPPSSPLFPYTTLSRSLASPAARHEPFFVFAHYMDPHDPYFVHPFNGEGYARVANPNPPASVAGLYRKLYDGEIAYFDEQLGVLLDDLRARGLYDRTLIVLTADHGEEFQEHGGWWHGTTLYDEQIHVPLVVKPPARAGGGAAGGEVSRPAGIPPTLLTPAPRSPPAPLPGASPPPSL